MGGVLGGVQVGEVEDVRFDGAREVLRLLGELRESGGVHVDRSDLGPGGRQPQRAGAADTAAWHR